MQIPRRNLGSFGQLLLGQARLGTEPLEVAAEKVELLLRDTLHGNLEAAVLTASRHDSGYRVFHPKVTIFLWRMVRFPAFFGPVYRLMLRTRFSSMNARFCFRMVCALGVFQLAAGRAADPEVASAPIPPAIKFQVLEGWQINLGNRAVILNRVVPPVLAEQPAAVVTPAPQLVSPEMLEAALRWERKKYEVIFISALVYDRAVTQLQWYQEGRVLEAFSNIDFNYFSGVNEIETDDTIYWLIMGIGDQTRAGVDAVNRAVAEQGLAESLRITVPPLAQFSATRSEYFLTEKSGQPTLANVPTAIDALHVYFDAHRQELIEGFAQREAQQIAREKWLKEHPPVPKNTVINFWPSAGTTTIEAGRKGVKP